MNIKDNIIKSTKEGKLYMTTFDFFNQEKIRRTITELLNSDIIKKIEERKLKRIMK